MFNFFKRKPNEIKMAKQIEEFVYDAIQTEKGVRVEDAIVIAATIVAERCIDFVGDYELRNHDFSPAHIILSESINQCLVGDQFTNDWNKLSKESVFGRIYQKTKPSFPINFYPNLTELFRNFIKHGVETIEFGTIPLSVPKDHHPFYIPLKVGYETRGVIDDFLKTVINDKEMCLRISIQTLINVILFTRSALDPKIGLMLTFETINGVSKIASLTDKAIKDLNLE